MKKITYLIVFIVIIFVLSAISVSIKNKKIYKGVKKNYKGVKKNYKGVAIASRISKMPNSKFQQIRVVVNENSLENMFKSLVKEGGRCESIFPDSDIIVASIRMDYSRKDRKGSTTRGHTVYSYSDDFMVSKPRPIPLLDDNGNIIPLKDANISFDVSAYKVTPGRKTFFGSQYNSGPIIQRAITSDGCVQIILLLAVENNKYYFCKLVLKEF